MHYFLSFFGHQLHPKKFDLFILMDPHVSCIMKKLSHIFNIS